MYVRETCHKGFVLLLTIVVMLVLSAIAASLIFSLSTDFRNAAVQSNNAKAFWLAEAGISDAVKRLKNNEITLANGTTNSSSIQNISLGEGTYSSTLSRSGQSITITSTGTVQGQNRTVTQIEVIAPLWPAAFSYAAFGTGWALNIGGVSSSPVTISGSVYYNGGSVVIGTNTKVINPGYVYANLIASSGVYTPPPGPPSPIPTYPSFDKTTYNNAITTAGSIPRSDFTLSGSSNLALAGGTVYYKNLTVLNNATITGPGTIVVTQDVSIGNSANIGPGVNIIAKRNITVKNSAIVQKDGVLYARKNITLTDTSQTTSSVLSPETNSITEVSVSAKMTGIIFSDFVKCNVASPNTAVINGSIVTNNFSGNVIANANITFNTSYLPTSIPTGFTGGTGYTKQADSWKEL